MREIGCQMRHFRAIAQDLAALLGTVLSGHSASQLIAVKRIRGNNFFVLVGLQTRIGVMRTPDAPGHPDTRTTRQGKMGEK